MAAVCGCGLNGNAAVADPTVSIAPGGPTAVSMEGVPTDLATTNDAVSAWLNKTVSRTGKAVHPLRRDRAARSESGRAGIPTGNATATGIGRLFWPLLVVLALIVFVALAFRKWISRSNRFGPGGVINVLAKHYLSPKQSLCLVKLGRRVMLVGVSPDCISTVAEIQDEEEAAAIVSAAERSKPGSFSSVFARLTEQDMGREPGGKVMEDEVPLAGGHLASTGANIRALVGRIRAMTSPTVEVSGRGTSAEPT